MKTFLTEYWDGAVECRMGGPEVEAESWKEAEEKALVLDVRLMVIGILIYETIFGNN